MHLMDQQEDVLRVEGLKKVYRSGQTDLVLFENLSFRVRKGEMLAIVGQSGAGKSSLLHILGTLDRASAGNVYCAQVQVAALSDEAAADFRNREIGFLWQLHYLLPEFTAQENVAMPLLMRGIPYRLAMEKAAVWLREVALQDRGHHQAGELSGGEQQRVALARALVTGPQILMADEPTGDLDNKTAEMVIALVQRLHHDYRLTSLIVTHNLDFARRCDRVLRLHQGHVEEVAPNSLTS